MKNKWGSGLLLLGQFLLVAALLLGAFECAALQKNYHMKLHSQLRSAEATGLTAQGVERATGALIRFLRGEDALLYEDQVYGQARPVFNEREISHMADVLALFGLMRAVRALMLATGGAAVILGMVLRRGNRPFAGALRQLRNAALLWTGLLLALVLYCALDFERAFVLFHHMLFTNDLWLLNPATDLMIRLLPEMFFMRLAGHIALYMSGALGLALAVGWIGGRRK